MAKCPDCGSEDFIHRRGSFACLENQSPDPERKKRNKAEAIEGLKKVTTFIAFALVVISAFGWNTGSALLVGGLLGYGLRGMFAN